MNFKMSKNNKMDDAFEKKHETSWSAEYHNLLITFRE